MVADSTAAHANVWLKYTCDETFLQEITIRVTAANFTGRSFAVLWT